MAKYISRNEAIAAIKTGQDFASGLPEIIQCALETVDKTTIDKAVRLIWGLMVIDIIDRLMSLPDMEAAEPCA